MKVRAFVQYHEDKTSHRPMGSERARRVFQVLPEQTLYFCQIVSRPCRPAARIERDVAGCRSTKGGVCAE